MLCRLFFLIVCLSPLQFALSAENHPPSAGTKFSGKQGEVLWIEVPVNDPQTKVSGTLLKRKIPFFPVTDTSVAAVVGIDMQDPPGVQKLNITVHSPNKTTHLTYSITIIKEDYAVQHLKLPKNKVDLDSKTLKRVRLEQKEMSAAFRHIGTRPLWDSAFLEPVKGTVTGRFGSRRIINGQKKRPHSGEDIAAPQGTPVYAINTGTVTAVRGNASGGQIDTEITSMSLSGGGAILVAGPGDGNAIKQQSLGTIVEQAGNNTLGDSDFSVFFQVNVPGFGTLWNHTGLQVQAAINCVSPDADYIPSAGLCIPLYDDPNDGEGVIVAYLGSADNSTFHDTVTSVPTVSEWGLIAMLLLCLTTGTVMYGRWRRAGAIG